MANAAVKPAMEKTPAPALVEGTLNTTPTTGTNNNVEVATVAYQLWEQRGRPEGDPDYDWYEAERLINAQNGG